MALSSVIVEQTDEARENERSENDAFELRRCRRGVDGGENISNSSLSTARRERSSYVSCGQHSITLEADEDDHDSQKHTISHGVRI